MAHYMQDFSERMRIIKGRLVRPAGSDPRALGITLLRRMLS